MPKEYTQETLVAKWSNRRFSTWVTSENFKKENGHWCVEVTCDCGEKWYVNLSCLAKHKHCTCDALKRVRVKKTQGRSDLEKIWPAVVKAGRKVMEKYNYASSDLRSFPN